MNLISYNSLNLFHLLSDKARMSGSSPPRVNIILIVGLASMRQCHQQNTGKLSLFFVESIVHFSERSTQFIATTFGVPTQSNLYINNKTACEVRHV